MRHAIARDLVCTVLWSGEVRSASLRAVPEFAIGKREQVLPGSDFLPFDVVKKMSPEQPGLKSPMRVKDRGGLGPQPPTRFHAATIMSTNLLRN
jgi:hypothetical protein